MKLWLMRHGQAVQQAPRDALRALTQHGCQEALDSAGQLLGRPLQAILVSPFVRARQTADRVCQALDYRGTIEIHDWLTPDSDVRHALDRLAERQEDELLLVSHQPLVGALAGLLIHGHRQAPLSMQTGSLAGLEGEMILAGGLILSHLHHPHC